MKKIFLTLTIGLTPILAVLNGAYAQDPVHPQELKVSKEFKDSDVYAKNEKTAASASASGPVYNSPAEIKSINKRALKHFTGEFNKANAVQWFSLADGAVAYCTVDGVRNRVFYNKNGTWHHTIMDYGEKRLPKDVRATVKSTYYDFSIIGANEIHIEDKVIYLVYIRDESTCKTLRICDGEMEILNDFKNS